VAVVMMMVAAESLAQVHDRRARCGGGFLRHIGRLGGHGKSGGESDEKHGNHDGGCAREFRE
jgi:hypothetical protein